MLLFQPHHYAAFNPPKPNQDDPATRGEREAVRDTFVELHQMLWPVIRREKWDLHPHWRKECLVSMTHFVPRIVQHISAMWLSYGKSEEQLDILKGMHVFDRKNRHLEEHYDAFYRHTRIQFQVDSSIFRCWLLLATHNNPYDRDDFIKRQLKDSAGKDAFFKLVRPLIDKGGFSYELTDVTVEPSKRRRLPLVSNLSQQDLIKFVKQDRDGFYSGIVKEYKYSDPALDTARIRDEMITNITLLFPLYKFMAWWPGK